MCEADLPRLLPAGVPARISFPARLLDSALLAETLIAEPRARPPAPTDALGAAALLPARLPGREQVRTLLRSSSAAPGPRNAGDEELGTSLNGWIFIVRELPP
mmetsp:Transcript_54716/g.153974  ORF Transcript_54716/g.153974 Transcript_54716/m.153974 type:complete len:103 (+) Transcript_54716:288-596(+)